MKSKTNKKLTAQKIPNQNETKNMDLLRSVGDTHSDTPLEKTDFPFPADIN